MDWLWEIVGAHGGTVNGFLTVVMALGVFLPPLLGFLCWLGHRAQLKRYPERIVNLLSRFSQKRVKRWLGFFRDFGPPLGLLGTVLGLVTTLGGMAEEPGAVAATLRRLAPALLTTVFGLLWMLGTGLGGWIANIQDQE